MTVKDLSRLYWLNREIESNQRQLDALKRTLTRALSGLPNCGRRLRRAPLRICQVCLTDRAWETRSRTPLCALWGLSRPSSAIKTQA